MIVNGGHYYGVSLLCFVRVNQHYYCLSFGNCGRVVEWPKTSPSFYGTVLFCTTEYVSLWAWSSVILTCPMCFFSSSRVSSFDSVCYLLLEWPTSSMALEYRLSYRSVKECRFQSSRLSRSILFLQLKMCVNEELENLPWHYCTVPREWLATHETQHTTPTIPFSNSLLSDFPQLIVPMSNGNPSHLSRRKWYCAVLDIGGSSEGEFCYLKSHPQLSWISGFVVPPKSALFALPLFRLLPLTIHHGVWIIFGARPGVATVLRCCRWLAWWLLSGLRSLWRRLNLQGLGFVLCLCWDSSGSEIMWKVKFWRYVMCLSFGN